MKVGATKKFFSDLNRIKSLQLIDDTEFIYDYSAKCNSAEDIPGFKWMTGYPSYGRISIGEYRIGVKISGRTIIFRCILHRSVIYKQFP